MAHARILVRGSPYHELNEFRTDADVNDAIQTGDNDFLSRARSSDAEVQVACARCYAHGRMPAAIMVRTAAVADTDALVELIGELGYSVAPADLPARVERLRTQGQGEILVAVQAGNVVGFAAVAITFPIHAAQPVAHLSAFAVSRGVRRQGVGRTLLAAVEQHAREAGCGRAMVGSAEQRADAHAFYVGSGWPYRGRRFGKVLDSA